LLINIMQDPLVGTTLSGKYEIQEVIGHGGMGVVYKARHALMERIVAIKMLQAQLISDSMSVKRFQQESKAASRISHPNVITIYDFGISPNGQPFIVMDYLLGTSLASVIKEEGQVGVERSIRIITQACDALEHAHKQGVIHRDLKPTNIVLINYDEEKDFVKVVDFGVAKLMNASSEGQRLTQQGEVCGSPVYMSPEQCTGLDLDPRSDIYSMGIVIYETLTGKLPLLGKTMVDTMSKHISEMPPSFSQSRPDLYIPERLEQVIFKALAKDPNDRHQTMEELKVDLELAIPRPGKSQVLRTAPADESSPLAMIKGLLKQKPVLFGVIALLVTLIGAFGFAIFKGQNPTPQPSKHAPVHPPADNATTPVKAPESTKGGATSSPTISPPAPPVTPPVTHKGGSKTRHAKAEGNSSASSESGTQAPEVVHRHAYGTAGIASPEESVENSANAGKSKPAHKPHKHTAAPATPAAAKKSPWASLTDDYSLEYKHAHGH
jgi:serine/threonine protein kinase